MSRKPSVSPSSRLARLLRTVVPVLRDRRGSTAIEYGLILALIVIVIIGAFTSVADVTIAMWGNVHTKVTNAR